MTVLQNYIGLEPGIPAKLHFTGHTIVNRTITDPQTGQPTQRNILIFDVDSLDGKPVTAVFSTMAEKLASQFSPYLLDRSYRSFDFTITQSGTGFLTRWTVLKTPR
jgi:hypothetical protein